MFCPKCGNQLPDGAQFCSTCGSPMNMQPATPVMPVEPVTPIMPAEPVAPVSLEKPATPEQPVMFEQPVMPAQPIMPEQPVMPAQPVMPEQPVMPAQPVMPEQPVMPAQPVMFEQPVMSTQPVMPTEPVTSGFTPAQQIPTNMAMPGTTTPTKKSKTPLFVGLGIGALLIAIIAIILVLLLTGDDDDDKKNPVAGTDSATTSIEETTTEEPTTEEPTTEDIINVDYDDATDVVEDFMATFAFMDYEDCVAFLYPGMAQFLEQNAGDSADEVLDDYSWNFYDENGDFFDYDVKNAKEDGSDYLDEYLAYGLDDCDDYVEPSAYAQCEVEFTYKDQTSSVILRLAYTDGKFYIIDFDDEDFEIIVEEETTTDNGTASPEEMAAVIESMINDSTYDYTISAGTYDGQLANGLNGAYTVMMPTGWNGSVNELNGYTYYYSPSNTTNFALVSDPEFGTVDAVTYLTNFCTGLQSSGTTVINLGKLHTPNADGYYVVGTADKEDGTTVYSLTYMLVDNTGSTVHCVSVNTLDATGDDAIVAEYVVASIIIQQ